MAYIATDSDLSSAESNCEESNDDDNNKYSWTLCHSISAIDHASLDGAV